MKPGLNASASANSGQLNQERSACPIVELRQYTLVPGQRDVLIELFERDLIEPQNEVGMEVLAHFRDLDAPDRFVWFRGFDSLASRGQALPAFYLHGHAWQTHREAANATMLDSDDVRLLREARPGSGFARSAQPRPPIGADARSPALVAVTAYAFAAPVEAAFLDFFDQVLAPVATNAGARLLATYASEHSVNNFPRLPVREGEHVFVWVAGFGRQADHARYLDVLAHSSPWRDAVQAPLSHWLVKPAEVTRLRPAARSLVQG